MNKCPCQAGVPCPQARGRTLTDEEFAKCNGDGVTEEERKKYVHDLLVGEEGPSILRKAMNFGMAMTKRVLDGFRDVDPEVKKYRLSICESCEHMSKERECLICGCPVDDKTEWATEHCPINLWPTARKASGEPSEARRMGEPPDLSKKGGCGCGGP